MNCLSGESKLLFSGKIIHKLARLTKEAMASRRSHAPTIHKLKKIADPAVLG